MKNLVAERAAQELGSTCTDPEVVPFDPRHPSSWGLTLSVDQTAQVLGLSRDSVYRMLSLAQAEQPQPALKVIRTGEKSRMVVTKSSLCRLVEFDIEAI